MHDEHELVATETSHDIALPRTVGEPLRHLPQHLVASQVTEGVVHHLEAVQIEKKHRKAVRAPVLRDHFVEAVQEQSAVREARQGVVGRLVGNGFLGERLIGHILDRHDRAAGYVPTLWPNRHAHMAILVATVLQAELRHRHLPRLSLVERGERLWQVVSVNMVDPVPAQEPRSSSVL